MPTAQKIFEGITGQDHAVRALKTAVRSGPSHAYLLAGPAGSGKMATALRLAAALCCEDDGCGACPSCGKALKGIHPDIAVVAPAGAAIAVDQVRELNRSLNLRPHESRARVFIITPAETMRAESANAFLKSLEEPPSFVFFILLAERLDRVLPTLVSRCQPVRFSAVPAEDIETLLIEKHGLTPVIAQALARVSGGNLALAEALASDPELAARRQRYLNIGIDLCRGAWEGGSRQLAAEVDAVAAEAGKAVEADTEEPPEGFEASAGRKRREQDAHRRGSAARQQELLFALTVLESWLRDMMVTSAGAGEAVLNRDYELELADRALPSRLDSYRQALVVVEATREKLGYNVDSGLALQAMFDRLQEVL